MLINWLMRCNSPPNMTSSHTCPIHNCHLHFYAHYAIHSANTNSFIMNWMKTHVSILIPYSHNGFYIPIHPTTHHYGYHLVFYQVSSYCNSPGYHCGHNLPLLDFDPPKKNIMGTPLNFKVRLLN